MTTKSALVIQMDIVCVDAASTCWVAAETDTQAASLGVLTSMVGKVWGSGVYTDDSSICAAALHAGVVPAGGGSVSYTILPGQERYQGYTRNGVSTVSYGKWKGSHRFE